jgi:hypothetical protein
MGFGWFLFCISLSLSRENYYCFAVPDVVVNFPSILICSLSHIPSSRLDAAWELSRLLWIAFYHQGRHTDEADCTLVSEVFVCLFGLVSYSASPKCSFVCLDWLVIQLVRSVRSFVWIYCFNMLFNSYSKVFVCLFLS